MKDDQKILRERMKDMEKAQKILRGGVERWSLDPNVDNGMRKVKKKL